MQVMQEYHKKHLDNLGTELALTSLKIGAIKLRPEDPFQWASGYRMPIYNDNRLLLSNPEYRLLVANIFGAILTFNDIKPDIIAGTSTSGIPPATTLADLLQKPLIYVRDKPKDHGLKNRIEGIPDDANLEYKNVVLIEDLISTGGSSVKAVQAIRDAYGITDNCLAIFNYGLDKAADMFACKIPFDDKTGDRLCCHPCNVFSALTYDKLLQVAKDEKYLNPEQVQLLEEWRADPFSWGEKHGFPKVEKK